MDEQTGYMIIALIGIVLAFAIFNHFMERKNHSSNQALIDVQETNKQIIEQLNGRLATFDAEYLNFIFEKISSEPENSSMYTSQYNDLKAYRQKWINYVHKTCRNEETIVMYARST
jgi:hypothetical protein